MEKPKFDEKTKQYYRRVLFPIIGNNVITGYNLYHDRHKSNAGYAVTYFHSDLGTTRSRHLTELSDRLKESCNPKIVEKITNSVVTRMAAYKIGDWEENPEGLRFFDRGGNEIQIDELESYEGIMVAEGIQFELNLEVYNRNELRDLLRVLKRAVNFYELDYYGRMKEYENRPKINPEAVHNAWEIPLITVDGEIRLVEFLSCKEVNIRRAKHEVSILVKRNEKLLDKALLDIGLRYAKDKKLANRLFVEGYLDL